MTFSCPFCTFECDDFDESDNHFTEHVAEYQGSQTQEFERYSE